VTAVFLPFCVAVIVVPAALWFAGRSKMVADQDEERRVAEAYEVPKVAAPDPPGGPILRGQGALLGVTSAELTAAWDGMLGAARAGDFNALRPCYTGEDWVLIAALPPGERARRAATSVQTDQLGLPAFLYAQKEWIEGLRLVSVGTVDESNKIAVDGTTVSVVRASGAARGPRGQLHFHLRAQVTERPGEPRRVEWTFPIHHVIQTK
jgi:hypothetical protein